MNDMTGVIDALTRELPHTEIRRGEPMKDHTSFKIGGRVSAMFFPKSGQELAAICREMNDRGVRPLIVGNGTNLLVEDGELELIVIKTHAGLSDIRQTGAFEITAGCGAALARVAIFAQSRGLTGLEFAHGIPGTLGGAVLMNAGAYGGEMGAVVTRTVTLRPDGSESISDGDDQAFSYRHSRFSGSGETIVRAVIRLSEGDPREIKEKMDTLWQKRRDSQPVNLPSAGSAFKRPAGGYAAALIDESGLKGFTVGGAMVSDKHAGFIVNRGGATFADVTAVLDHVRETVFKRTGIELEPEIRIIRAADR